MLLDAFTLPSVFDPFTAVQHKYETQISPKGGSFLTIELVKLSRDLSGHFGKGDTASSLLSRLDLAELLVAGCLEASFCFFHSLVGYYMTMAVVEGLAAATVARRVNALKEFATLTHINVIAIQNSMIVLFDIILLSTLLTFYLFYPNHQST